jgi:hypothetical protein
MTVHGLPAHALIALLLLATPLAAGDLQIYEHPSLDFRFEALPDGRRQPHPEDRMIYEIVDPKTDVHVVLWYTTTEQSGRGYLKKMADMKDLVVDAEPVRRLIGGREAWLLDVAGIIAETPIRTLLAVIPCGKSPDYPKENALYVVQIWCPEDAYEEHARLMAEILHSVRIVVPRDAASARFTYRHEVYPLYPATLAAAPGLPSPLTSDDGEEIVTVGTANGEHAFVPVTVANGGPLDCRTDRWGKGRQLAVDGADFPALARTGLHSEQELSRTTTITGRPVAEITAIGRPGRSSTVGFMGHDEDIVSVLRGDNGLVARMGLTHPHMAKPLFKVWNLCLRAREAYKAGLVPWEDIDHMVLDGRKIFVRASGGKGWQESIFDDEVLGVFRLRMWRELEPDELTFLRERYGALGEERLSELMEMLSSIQTGEMVPYYIMRYGFYEGHTDYRADPISIAAVFGLKSIAELDADFDGRLYDVLTRRFTKVGSGP